MKGQLEGLGWIWLGGAALGGVRYHYALQSIGDRVATTCP